jgi:hypothetical protein
MPGHDLNTTHEHELLPPTIKMKSMHPLLTERMNKLSTHRSYLNRVVYKEKTWKKKGNYHMTTIVIVLRTCPLSNHKLSLPNNEADKNSLQLFVRINLREVGQVIMRDHL